MEPDSTYRISLPQFEGPFDLLLFFIERDELDIHDIPIAQITREFLTYLTAMQALNIELASEFILVAATLMKIKAKMLLPRPVLNEAGEEIDPREELVRRLLEYKRYKAVLAEIAELEAAQSQRVERGFIKTEEKILMQAEYPEEELVGMDLFTIMRTFKRIWERHNEQLVKPTHVIKRYPYDIGEVKRTLTAKLSHGKPIDFVSFILEEGNRIYAVFSFLAILELVQLQQVSITIGEGYNNFWMSAKTTT